MQIRPVYEENNFFRKKCVKSKNNCEKVLSLYGILNMQIRPVYEGINF